MLPGWLWTLRFKSSSCLSLLCSRDWRWLGWHLIIYMWFIKRKHTRMCALFLADFQHCILGKLFVGSHQMKSADNQPHPLCFDLVQEVCLIPLQLLQIPTCHLKAQSPVFALSLIWIFFISKYITLYLFPQKLICQLPDHMVRFLGSSCERPDKE